MVDQVDPVRVVEDFEQGGAAIADIDDGDPQVRMPETLVQPVAAIGRQDEQGQQ